MSVFRVGISINPREIVLEILPNVHLCSSLSLTLSECAFYNVKRSMFCVEKASESTNIMIERSFPGQILHLVALVHYRNQTERSEAGNT